MTDAVGGDPRVIEGYVIEKLIPFNPVDKKTAAHLIMPDGTKLIVTKGAPQVWICLRDYAKPSAVASPKGRVNLPWSQQPPGFVVGYKV